MPVPRALNFPWHHGSYKDIMKWERSREKGQSNGPHSDSLAREGRGTQRWQTREGLHGLQRKGLLGFVGKFMMHKLLTH